MALPSEEAYEQVRSVLLMQGWNQVMMPTYAQRAREALVALTLSPSERLDSGSTFKKATDEELRATIRENEWMLAVWKNEVANYDANRRRDELDRQPEGVVPTIPATANP